MAFQLFDWYGGGNYDSTPWPPAIDVTYRTVDSTQWWGESNTSAAVKGLGLTPQQGGALVLGRFDPPHLGHAFLIRAARASSEGRTHVCVFSRPGDFLPGPNRVYALQRLTANRNTEVREVKVDEAFPTGAPEAERWAAWFRSSGLEGAVARLVSSDPNARAFAERVGLDFVLVDPSRRAFPISSTAVRADPWAAWSALIPELHPFFARIVAFIGPEGGGKSTALAQLAKHYDTASGGEYLSAIANGLTRALSPSDLSGDALTGTRQTVGSVRSMANRFGLIDGDAVQVKLWFERLFPSEKPLALEPNMWNHHYLVFDDHPWTGAPGKDEPEARRRMVHDAIKLLEANGKSFSLISGPREARPQRAIEAIDAWVKTKPALRK